MITRHQALTTDIFHENHEPAGKIYQWRRNGATLTWKTRPDEFRIPVKYGLRSYGQITDKDACRFHAEQDCPTRHVRVNEPDGSEWSGIIISEPVHGMIPVQVTTRGGSRFRVGSRVSVPVSQVSDL